MAIRTGDGRRQLAFQRRSLVANNMVGWSMYKIVIGDPALVCGRCLSQVFQ